MNLCGSKIAYLLYYRVSRVDFGAARKPDVPRRQGDSAECAAEHAGHVVTMVEVERQSCERPEALGAAALSKSLT